MGFGFVDSVFLVSVFRFVSLGIFYESCLRRGEIYVVCFGKGGKEKVVYE